jgi:hypothetical protein
MDNLTQGGGEQTTRPRLTAYALVLAPALVAVGNALAGHEADSAAGVLADVSAAPHRFFLSRALFYTGMLLLLPGVITLMRLAPDRGRRWATVGGILAGVGAAGYGGGEFMLGYSLPLITEPAIDRGQALAAYTHLQADLLGAIPFLLGLLAYVGPAVVAVGVVRARAMGRGLGVALVVTPLVWFAAAAGSYTVGALGALPLVVTYIVLVRQTLGRPAGTTDVPAGQVPVYS